MYNSLITQHRAVKRLLSFYLKDFEQYTLTEQSRDIAARIVKEYASDLVTTSRAIADPAEIESGRHLVYQLYNFQNPSPPVDVALSVLGQRNYCFLPSDLTADKIDASGIIEKTLAHARRYLFQHSLQLLSAGFSAAFEPEKNMMVFESAALALTFTVDYYELAEGGQVFWALWDW